MASEVWRATWYIWILYSTVVTLVSPGASRVIKTPVEQKSFNFTRARYDATIPENAAEKTYVTFEVKVGIYLSDPTLGMRYKIISGDSDTLFRAEDVTVGDFCFLKIRTRSGRQKVINRESTPFYKLTIKATGRYRSGPSFIAHTTVDLRVLDANDLSPIFHPTMYKVNISEFVPLHTRVAQVTASDADIGVNGEVYFSFSQSTKTFAIHPTSGVVTVTAELRHRTQSFYDLEVLAWDRGSTIGYGKRINRARLIITVLELNYFAPEIKLVKRPAVIEHGKVGTIYAILNVVDTGNSGHIESVEIIQGDPNGYFRIVSAQKPSEFRIQVAKTLDRELYPGGFNLTIRATDMGKPAKNSTVTVHVTLWDTNDNAPVFHKSHYEVSVDECVPVQTPLLFVNASDHDLGKNAEIVYDLMDTKQLGWFTVNSRTGLIHVKSAMDAEQVNRVELLVSAHDQANKGSRRVSSCSVIVTIQDCNDNSPIFNVTNPVVSIPENYPVGTEVYKVSAYDLDKGENRFISYSIANEADNPFVINHFSGRITTKKVLDYESMKRVYKLRIRASDWGSPYRRETETILTVKLKDVNDNKPRFEKVDCVGHLSREAPVGTKLVVVSAIDFDAGNIISYHIISGNNDKCFEVLSSTGLIRTKCDLRRRTDVFISLVITATDGVNQADSTTVNITFVNNNRNRQLSNKDANFICHDTHITEELGELLRRAAENNPVTDDDEALISQDFMVNVNTPKFISSTPDQINVPEGVPLGQKILELRALDPDHGYNGKLMYVISAGNTGGIFKVGTNSGDLFLIADLDREVRDKYTLNISVTDMGVPPKAAYTIMDVIVEDINDNPPKFEKPSYTTRIFENVDINTTVLQVSSTDNDLGANAEISYSLLTDMTPFKVHPKTGVITVSGDLDREVRDIYHLQVKATDNSPDNQLSSIVPVTVHIGDRNDNSPKFMQDTYVVKFREDTPVGAVVVSLSAHDPDLRGGGEVQYRFVSGVDDKFTMDKHTGIVRLQSPLDFEQKQLYNISVRARDRGRPSLSSKGRLIVEVVDVNENIYPPKFSNFVFEGSVKENEPRNTTVLQVSAIDADRNNPKASPKDYQLVYSIRGGTGQGLFTIDNKGVIRTNLVLDRETRSHYWLSVYVQDRGTIPLSSRTEVLVRVEDVNDNIPQTKEPVYYPTVRENSPRGTPVVQLTAYDGDDIPNNQITYDLTSGNPQGFFQIDRNTGLISTTSRHLDREKQEEHILEVTVGDRGKPPLSSTTRVVVTISDENDHIPVFTERLYRVRIPQMPASKVDMPLYRVLAYDADKGANADVDYIIKSGMGNGRFTIHAKTGMIHSQREFTKGSQYELTIKAVDNGRPQMRSTARVMFTVVEPPSTSSNAPTFSNGHLQTQVMENDRVGHMVCLMSAVDADGDKIWYSITAGNQDDTFSIDTENGNIILARPLDWETTKNYNLTIQASDGVHFVYTWVYVSVLDINDNRPEFSQSVYTVEVAENTAPGTDVMTVSATDRDEDQRLFYTIHSSTDQISRSKFKINSETGTITTIDKLDREAINRHELTIMVRDQAPSKRSLARIVFIVTDHNDFPPEFLASKFEAQVYETAGIGTSVLQVLAVDRDKGPNGQVHYTISSGNVGNAFAVDETQGLVAVAKPLDVNPQPEYNLVIKATDGGTPSLSSSVPVQIRTTIANNAPPRFAKPEYTSEISENRSPGTPIIGVAATCRSSVVYDIIEGNEANFFLINPNSGLLVSNSVFDYEEASFFNLTVRATNMVGVYKDTHVLVHIIDQNDHSPVFTNQQYVGNVSETAHVGSFVLGANSEPLVIKATDADSDLNALLIYIIVEPAAQEVFDIDASTGAIRTKVNLDHEVTTSYDFTVQVTDMGFPRRSAEVPAKVMIHVIDVNDSPPEFSKSAYRADLFVPTYMGVEVIKLEATDKDSDATNKLEYSVVKGNALEHFTVNADSGSVTVATEEDLLSYYELVVRVTDGKHDNKAVIGIHVQIAPTSGLHFTQEIYYAEMMENKTEIQAVTVVQALGHALNEHLTFSILNPTEMFRVGDTSGVVHTTGIAFDRELRENYTLVIEVRDQRKPPRIAHVLVHVKILDINDNSPVFLNQPYYVIVPIDAATGSVVKQVSAVDMDIGLNGQIVFKLLEGGERKFAIKAQTGEIVVKKPLNQDDQNKEYKLIIEASDQGEEPRSTAVDVVLTVMNKATPVFTQPFYSVSVPENIPVHAAILSIQANSQTGRKLIYSIQDGDIYGEFAVDFNTGSVTVVDTLDYETIKSYQLTVRATDEQSAAYSDTIVHITLEDINDHAPQFGSLSYSTTISEAAPIGTSLLTVSAKDKDSGLNAKLHYHLEHLGGKRANDTNYFHIDTHKGIILTKQKLDHEMHTNLVYVVVATDGGIPARSSSVRVTVSVTDTNDNTPSFEQPVYEVIITDLAARGQFVTIVTASDPDSSDAENLVYSIVGGNKQQAFVISSRTGIISLSRLRKPNLISEYQLNVSVSDGVFTNFARVRIQVKSSNKHAPVFVNSMLDVDLVENMPAGELVTTVTATDEDGGDYGKVTYAIGSEKLRDLFRIDKDTGKIFTKVVLDREDTALYQLPLLARDGGGRMGYSVVRVNVADQADHKPQFKLSEYKANVYDDAKLDSIVLQVSAVDHDLGSNGDISFTIVDSPEANSTEYFRIDPASGNIFLLKSLARKQNELMQFFVRVTDKSSPPQDSDVPVEVYIMGPEDFPPVFEHENYQYFIPEDTHVGAVIATIVASSNETVAYSIVSGMLRSSNNPAKFDIDPEGKVSLLEPLDRETTETYELAIKAETQTSPPLVAYTHVTVSILDVNDNSPTFQSNPYVVSLAENTEIGSRVVQVVAIDYDTGANGDVTYDFAPSDSKLSNVFGIDSRTGWITTLVELDRETNAEFSFRVISKDRGTELQLSDMTTVKIAIMDHNDEPPVFERTFYKGSVNEDALPGTVILTVTTTDRDLGDNARVAYYITDGDPRGRFSIRHTGEVYVHKPLDRETTDNYILTVSATDGAFVSTAKVDVTILDANDNAPVCEQPQYTEVIPEDTAPGTYLLQVSATDADDSETSNGRIDYILEGDPSALFTMHKKSGTLLTAMPLDRETQAQHHLVVSAVDGGGLFCTVDVYITLLDINDNAPQFTMDQYEVNIAENAEIHTLLTRVVAVDSDIGINRKVKYALKETDTHFKIDPVSGILSLTHTLDREKQPTYNLTVYAHDEGTPKMTSTTSVIVQVRDINDNPPEFARSTYHSTVSEATEVGKKIATVFATSLDSGINAVITYTLIAGNEQGKFAIDSKSGAMTTVEPLDFETTREYFLTIQANDGGSPSLSNTAIVNINVTDANDNAPVFAQHSYPINLREDVPTGTKVVQVQATDLDSAPNARLSYHIAHGDPRKQFKINPKNGQITVRTELDRETIASYSIEVHGVDSGAPSLTGTTVIYVTVLDVNDNAPQFTQPNYTAVIQEDKAVGHSILQVQVADADADPNGAPFSFDIVQGNAANEFRIDRNGVVSTAAKFNRQIKDTYHLSIRVFDNGEPPLYSDAKVVVNVIEESAFPPVITPLEISVTAYHDLFPGGVVGRVKAIDPDMYDQLTYAVVSDNQHLFDIDSLDGTMEAVQSLDGGNYVINISVSDGKYQSFTDVKLKVDSISQTMAKNAVVVRFRHLLPEEFVAHYREKFVHALKNEIPSVRHGDVKFLSLQLTPVTTEESVRRKKRSSDSDLDVLFAVHKVNNNFVKGNALRRKLAQAKSNIEKYMGVEIVRVFNDVCDKDMCEKGVCETEVRFYDDDQFTIITDKESFVSAKHSLEPQCRCKPGYGGPRCEDSMDVCSPSPCKAPQVCFADGLSYRCECPPGKTGENCKDDEREPCNGSDCAKELTFTGQSYIRWRMTTPMERRLSLALEVKTVQSTARLMHAVGRVDYSILEIDEGVIQYRFDCGSGPGLARVDKVSVSDGFWHTVAVERNGNFVKIVLDGNYIGEGSAPGTNDVLNLNSNELFFGAEVSLLAHGYEDMRRGFVGCMKHIKIEGIELPLVGSTSVGLFLSQKNIEFHCRNTYIPGGCGGNPCQNGGLCIPTSQESFMCKCADRFVGPRCGVDTNPCASAPCLFGGSCENVGTGFRCHCQGNMKGKHCEAASFCEKNPCKHKGICTEGVTGAVCNCRIGYEGDLCEKDINECLNNPCMNGAVCHNTRGSFKCNCTQGSKGNFCEDLHTTYITSSTNNFRWEEIAGIAAVVVALIIIGLLVVLLVRWRRRKRRRQSQSSIGTLTNNQGEYICKPDDNKRTRKLNNAEHASVRQNLLHNHHQNITPSPRPPPVPTRPASYTPSTADSMNTLNFDTARNYGSAADDLENYGSIQQPIEIPDFLKYPDVEKSPKPVQRTLPAPPEEEALLGKSAWDSQNPNIAENYPEDMKKQNKSYPADNRSAPSIYVPSALHNGYSLPVSESEDDAPGYHWDTSDWHPDNSPLPKIAEVAIGEVHDSGSSSSRSQESNLHVDPEDYENTDYPEEFNENDSEYVGDSEYCENECGESDIEDPNLDFREPPKFEEILDLNSYDDEEQPELEPHNYSLHPDHYLPQHEMGSGQSIDDMSDSDGEVNGNAVADNFARDDLGDVIYYGFPVQAERKFAPNPYDSMGPYNIDYDHSVTSALDNMSVSIGGYTSTNASTSDISGLCELEESEPNLSDNEGVEDSLLGDAAKSSSHVHTDV